MLGNKSAPGGFAQTAHQVNHRIRNWKDRIRKPVYAIGCTLREVVKRGISGMKRSSFVTTIFLCSQLLFCQEFRSTTTVTSNSQAVTVDLSNVSDVRGASITIRNSSSGTISLPQISTPNNLMPLSGPAILAQLNSLPPASTDQDRATQAWQFMLDHSIAFCSAGKNGKSLPDDPIKILNGFGFGCCDQLAQTLAWIWQQEGYQARVAAFTFHTVPEIFYNNSWHMLDPDHRVYYPKDDGTIASVADILADTTLISRNADSNGRDPVGYLATTMADAYVEDASTLQYVAPFYTVSTSGISLRSHESLTVHSENLQDSAQFYALSAYLAPSAVNSAQFDWDLSFGNSGWKQLTSAANGVDVTTEATGAKSLANTTSTPGYVVYEEVSTFPVLNLSIRAQLGASSSGSLNAYFSTDGIHWSSAVPFQAGNAGSSFDLGADLTALASANYSYFVKIELVGGMQLHRLRISPIVQTSRAIFPALAAGSPNQLLYQDSSPAAQVRSLQVTTAVPVGRSQIHGLHAESLVPESPSSSLALDYGAASLVDGDPDSLAYPGSSHIDYVIQLNGTYNVTGVSIDWGYFGSDSRYVESWQILGRSGNQAWQPLATGGLPGQATMDVPLNATATELRLVANSSHWIGAYDLRVFGGAVAPGIPASLSAIQSNVPEDPVYSIASHYGAANLIDGNPNTLAYPAAKNVDYQISLGVPTYVSSANISWGVFGTNPAYVTSWSLLARNGADGSWTTVGQGGFPNSASTQVSLDFLATDIRIIADSSMNWIGIYDLQLNGGQLMSGLAVNSNVQDQAETSSVHPTSDLSDGDESTFAYPGNISLDYTIDPGENMYFAGVRVVWGSFGTSPNYIQSWRLLGLTSDGTWEVAARGGFPNSSETVVPVDNRYRKLRVAAAGPNWNGIYEVQAFGSSVPPPGQFTVHSNVIEDPVYSLAHGYQASNLIDGDPTTLAYPGSTHIDYQVSLGQPTQLSSALINWGVFGTDAAYVGSWSLLARNGADQPWVTLASGGYPDSAATILNLDFAATDVRIIGDSVNWIGLYDLQIKGSPLQ